ncbi:hypothetical protein [Arcobacter sp.]|uniref:hypothetical protein n=1 Tax=unclassified Arcobacter TaxID=2593671 RepID=UPI003AFFE14A
MPIDQDKIKATDYLIESLKLIVVVVTILMTGLLTFHDQVNTSNKYYFYISIFFWLITLVWSIINLNLLINKVYRSEEDAIKQKDTKSTFTCVTITLFLGIVFGIIFLFNLSSSNQKNTIQANQISITNQTIIIDGNFSKKIKIMKFEDGSIKEITIN